MNNQEIIIIEENHLFSSDEKIKWWGCGEWVKERDFISFTYKNIECKILRIAFEEPKIFHMFGGYLNGYVSVPSDHPYYQKKYEDMEIECHGGLTFGQCSDSHLIGFDCAHSGDYVPSSEMHRKKYKFREIFPSPLPPHLEHNILFNPVYRNIQFCIGECKSIVDQIIEKSEL